MPGLRPTRELAPSLDSLVPFLHAASSTALSNVTDAVTLAGSPLVSLVLVGLGVLALWRRGDRGLAVALAGAFVVGNVAEIVAKSLLERPALFAHGLHVRAFDQSYPSGHALRCALVAATGWMLRPRLAPLLALWLVAAAVLLVAGGWHTPTDVAGGLLLAGFLVAAAPRTVAV